jgi:hypothetical protein
VTVEVKRAAKQRVEVIRRGVIDEGLSRPVTSDEYRETFKIQPAEGDWLRLNLRDETGLTVLTNPLYFRR